MSISEIRYDLLVEKALRGVIRSALQQVAQTGLPGEHHFYITFNTNHEGVEIPSYLRTQYKDEMTIVLQHQYFGLEIEEDYFSVTLSFNSKHERLVIPFAAIGTFADPAVNFALQLQTIPMDDEENDDDPDGTKAPKEDGEAKEEERGQVISLDSFRKKP